MRQRWGRWMPLVLLGEIVVILATGVALALVWSQHQGYAAINGVVITATPLPGDVVTPTDIPAATDTPTTLPATATPPPTPTVTPVPAFFTLTPQNATFHCDFQQPDHEGDFTVTNSDSVDHMWGSAVHWTPEAAGVAFEANPNSSTSAGNTEVHPGVSQGVGVTGAAPVGTVVTVTIYATDNGVLGAAQGQVSFTCA